MSKHAALPPSDISSEKNIYNKPLKTRNSSVELLRIISMFMILAYHFILHNGYSVKDMPLGWEKIFSNSSWELEAKWGS